MFLSLALAPTLTLALLLEAGNPDVCIIHKCTTIRHALKAQAAA